MHVVILSGAKGPAYKDCGTLRLERDSITLGQVPRFARNDTTANERATPLGV
jgi:hypothetical protein